MATSGLVVIGPDSGFMAGTELQYRDDGTLIAPNIPKF